MIMSLGPWIVGSQRIFSLQLFRIKLNGGKGTNWGGWGEMTGAGGDPLQNVRREQLCGHQLGCGGRWRCRPISSPWTTGWGRRSGKATISWRSRPGQERKEPLLLPPEPAGTSKNGSGQELSTGRPLPPLLAGDSEGTGYLPGHKGCFQLPGNTSVLHLSLPDPRMSSHPRIP